MVKTQNYMDITKKTLELNDKIVESQKDNFQDENKKNTSQPLVQADYSSILPESVDETKMDADEEKELTEILSGQKQSYKFNHAKMRETPTMKNSGLVVDKFDSEAQKQSLENLVKSTMSIVERDAHEEIEIEVFEE